jgi:Mitochondrial carrier protein
LVLLLLLLFYMALLYNVLYINIANILSNSHKGIWETAIELYQESGGGHGLYRGFGLKLIRSIPASMIGFLVYEQVASLYG